MKHKIITKEKYCKYCGDTEKEILKERRKTGKRGFCFERDTPKGFHKFSYREKKIYEI